MHYHKLLSASSLKRIFCQFLGISALALPQFAHATEPLSTFLGGAEKAGFDAREQRAITEQRSFETQAALGRLLPSFNARGTVTHNQYAAELPPGTFPGQTEAITITPQNQFDATFTLTVPIVDVAQVARYKQARHLQKAAEAGQQATGSDLSRAVAQAYYTFLGASALVEAAESGVDLAEQNLKFVTSRRELGVVTNLDLVRAKANLERAKRDLVDAELVRTNSARNLQTLSGISPSPADAYPEDTLEKEAPLDEWLRSTDTPSDRVSRELNLSAKYAKRAAAYSLFPTLSASATERITNATGFAGQASSYTIQGVLNWNLDYGTYAGAKAQAAAAEVQKIRVERSRRGVEDSIFDAYHRVEASIAKSASARIEADASAEAARLSLQGYQAGALTQLDVTQSQRDAFLAQAAKIKADSDLALARVLLRVAAGRPPEVSTSQSGVRLGAVDAKPEALGAPPGEAAEPSSIGSVAPTKSTPDSGASTAPVGPVAPQEP